jgi:hypothetical protein
LDSQPPCHSSAPRKSLRRIQLRTKNVTKKPFRCHAQITFVSKKTIETIAGWALGYRLHQTRFVGAFGSQSFAEQIAPAIADVEHRKILLLIPVFKLPHGNAAFGERRLPVITTLM